jgi:hypothetical protein
VIDIPYELGKLGTTNSVRINNMILSASPIADMERDNKYFEAENNRVNFMSGILSKLGVEPIFINLSEFDKSGASLSCFLMHLNGFNRPMK